ncbi:MAG: hypothetical protein AAF614_01185 [Chloroflexota bacterium]
MTVHFHSVKIPDSLYHRLRQQAKEAKMSVDVWVEQTLSRHLPPPVEEDLPDTLQDELEAMANLSDAVLWQIAESQMNADKVALYDLMLERFHADELTSEGQQLLNDLRDEAQALTLRKAHAYALLQSRGHVLPTLEELQNRSSS